MGRVARARRIAVAAAYGGGGLSVLGAVLAAVLVRQAMQARRAIQPREFGPPCAGGHYGAEFAGEPLTLALLGDSSMLGYGVDTVAETPGAMFATGLAQLARRPVRIVSVAMIGAESRHLGAQVDTALLERPHAAVILVGGNDVTHRVRQSVSVGHLRRAVRGLVGADIRVVVGTCPDLGTIRPIPQPLRWIARRLSRDLGAAQTIATVEAGGRTVSLADLLGPEFAAHPGELFSEDRFHPSAAGYARAVSAILPSLAAALGVGDDPAAAPRSDRGEGVRSLPSAAVEAVDAAGTEVTATAVAGRARGPWGTWAELRHRIRVLGGDPARPDASAPSPEPPATPPSTGAQPSGQAPPEGSPEAAAVRDNGERERAVEGAT